jgi:LPS-assembly lipoprotein
MASRLTAAASRRRLAGALVLSAALAGCGFRLRGSQSLPFDTVFIDGPRSSLLAVELARAITGGSATRVVEDRGAAQALVEIRTEARETDVLSVNAQGRAREYRIRLRVVFAASDGKGREYLAPTTIIAFRDLAVTEEQTLAREYEEAQLVQDMLIDVAQQILRRLAALKP